jgi:hypothetical protein
MPKAMKTEEKKKEFWYSVINQYETFICVNLMVKNMEVPIERYFKW